MTERMRELFDAVTQDPTNVDAAKELERLLRSEGEWASLVNLLQSQAEQAVDPVVGAGLYRRAAVVATEELGDKARAVELYGLSLEGDEAEALPSLMAMRGMLFELEAWADFVQVAEAEVERTEAPEARAVLCHQMGEVLEERTGDAEKAMQCYQAAFREDPACLRALWAARRLYRQHSQWEMVAQLLELELESADDDARRAEILRELSDVLLFDLDAPELARRCLTELVKLSPDDEETAKQLDELGGPLEEEAAEEAEEAPAEAAVVEEAEEAVAEEAEEAPAEAAVVEEAEEAPVEAAVAEEAEEAPVEAAVAEETTEDEPQAHASTAAPEDVGRVVADLEAEAGALEGEARAAKLTKAVAALSAAGGVGELARIYLDAVKAAPADVGIYWRAGRTITADSGTLEAIAAGLDALAEADHGGEAAALKAHRLMFGAVHLDQGKGVDFKLRDLVKKSDSAAVVDWQVQRLVETGKWRNIQQMLTEQLGGDPGEARNASLREMAELAEDRAGDSAKAADFWRQVHQADKTNRAARQALLRLYRETEKWKPYAEVLKLEVEDIPDDQVEDKIAGLRQLVETYTTHVKMDAAVVQLYAEILALDPDDEEAMGALVEKYEAMRRWPDLVGVLQQQAARADDEARTALNLRIAHLYLEKFRNQAEAIKAFEVVLDDEPENAEALGALDGMYEKRRDWEKLVAVRRTLAELESEPEAQTAAYKALAEYAGKKIRRADICLELWELVLEVSPGDEAALSALVGFYEQAKDWEKLVATIDELVEQVSDDKARVELLQKAGVVVQDRIGDKLRSVEVWQRLLEIDANHRRGGDSLKKALIELGDWDGLTEFFGQREKWSELVRILDGQVGVQKDEAVKIDLLFRAATIYQEHLEQADRAVRALERVLQIEPKHLEGARALAPTYEAKKDHRKLANVLEVLLEHEEDRLERRTIMLRLAELSEAHLRNPDGAFEWVRRVVDEGPADAEAGRELERLGEATHQWATVHDDLVAALGKTGELAEVSGAELRLLLSVARILDEQMGANEEALQRYQEALELEPESRVALDAIEALHTRTASWHELLEVLERKLALAEDVEARKALLRKQGMIHEAQLGDADAAIDRHRAIIEEDEADLEALDALHRLFTEGERWDDLHDIVRQQLGLAEAREGADVLGFKMQMGRLELSDLGQTSEAVTNFSEVLAVEPGHDGAREALEGLLTDAEHRGDVALVLEPIYVDFEAWEKLAQVLEIQLEEAVSAAQRLELLERIGTLHRGRRADIEQAFGAFARMLRDAPESRVALTQLTELSEAGDRWAELTVLLEEVVPDVSDETLAMALLAQLAELYEGQLDDVAQAIDAHRRVLDLDMEARASVEALDRLYLRSQQWSELLSIYRRKLEMTEIPEEKEALQFQIAALLEDMLGEPQEAITVYGEIIEITSANGRALEALSRLYGQEGMWPELADTLERQLQLAEDVETQIGLRVRLGGLHERELGNVEVAIQTYRTILEAEPDNTEAVEALERLISEADFRLGIADILEPFYTRNDQWQRLIEVYEIQREEAEEEQRKVDLLHRIARLHQDRAGDAEEAFRSYARAFVVQPGEPKTLAQLHTLAEALGLWAELVAVYEGEVEDISDQAVATDVHKRTAKVQLHQLGELHGARDHYEAAYSNDDTDFETIEALEEIYFQSEQWNELVATILRKAELTDEAEDKKALFFRVSAIYEEMLEDPERAVEIFEMVLEVDEVDERALLALERIFLVLQRWEDLMDVLHKKAALTTDLGARKEIYYIIGATYERELTDLQRAVETYVTVLEWDALDLNALQSLDRLYLRLEHWDELLALLAREVAVSTIEPEQYALRFRAGRIHEEHLDAPAEAVETYRGILADEPEHEPTLGALEVLVRDDREAVAAAAVLEPVLKAAGAWVRMVSVWRDLLEVTTDLEVRTALYTQIGVAYEDMLVENEPAFTTFGQAFAEDPTHEPTLVALERVAGRAEMWSQLVELVSDELGNISSEYVARDLYLRIARVFEEEMENNPEAIERFRRVMEIDPDHEGAILALDRLYQKQGMWAELAEILVLEAERADDEARAPLLLRLGTLYENALEDVPAAIEAYKDVLGLVAQEPEAVTSLERLFEYGHEQPLVGTLLEPIYLENEDWPKLHGLLQALLAHVEPGEDRMRAMHRLAELCLARLEDEGRAFEWYGAAFKEVPEDEHSRSEAARLAGTTGRYAELVTIYTEGLQNTQDLELVGSVSHEMALVYRDQLEDAAAAETMYQYILESIDPADVSALLGMDGLLEGQGRWPELVEVLRREIEATYEEEARLAFMFRLGQLFEGQLAEIEQAVEQYQGILDQTPLHPGALDRLEQIYQLQGEWAPLFDILERQAELTESDPVKAKLYARQAMIAAEFLDRPEDAVDLWSQVLDLSGEDPEALMALEGLYEVQESWRELVDVCERQINLVSSDEARELALYAKLGRVWGDALERERNALENWQKVLDRRPEDVEALWAMRGLYERTDEHAEVAKFNHRLLDLLDAEEPKRLMLFRQLGLLYQEALEQPTAAIEAWRQVLTIHHGDEEAIEALEELYTAAEDWTHCVGILERKVSITHDEFERVSLLFRVAEMYEEQLQSLPEAQQTYQLVMEVQADNIDAFQQLERLYEGGEQWAELVDLLLARLEHTQDAYERQEIFLRTSKTFESKLGSLDHAFVVLAQAFEELDFAGGADDESFGDELERLAGAAEKWPEVVSVYESVVQTMGSIAESVPLRMRVARWYDDQLDQPQHAGTHYQYVLSIDPDHLGAMTALELLLGRFENWPKVVEVIERKVDLLLEPEAQKASLEKMAEIQERRLDLPDAAIEAYRRILLIDGDDLASYKALERLYAIRQRWADLIECLEQQVPLLEDEGEVVDTYLRVAELWETRMHAPDRAILAYRQTLTVDTSNLESMKALEKLYAQQDQWVDLLDVYELMLEVSEDAAEQLKICTKVALIQEQELSDPEGTIDTYRRMMEIEPSEPTSVRALDRLYRETERWDDLADIYGVHLEAIDDAPAKIAIRTALSEIYAGPLRDAFKAVEVLAPVLEIDEAHQATLGALSDLYAQTEDWHNCIDMLSREAHLLNDRSELLERQCRVGQIYQEKLGDLEQAERWFRSALEHDPRHLMALGALKEIYAARAEWNDVVRVLKMMEAATRGLADKSERLFEIGRVFDKHLDESATAVDYYEQAMDLHPGNASAALPLVEVYWRDQRWERAEPLLDLILENQPTDVSVRDLQRLHFQIAYCGEQLNRDDKALTHYRKAYELDSTHLQTLQGMGALLFRREDWDRAFKIYQTVLVHHRERLDSEEIVEVFFRQGAIKLKVAERRKALDFFRKALDLEPAHRPTLEAAIALHESQGDWEDAIFYRQKLLEQLESGRVRFNALVAIGDLFAEQLKRPKQAIQAYRQAAEEQPESRVVLGKLIGLYEEAGNWSEAVNVLNKLAELETDPGRQAKYYYAIGAIQRDYLKDNLMAVRTFDRALDAEPGMLKAFMAIDQILTKDKDYERQDRYYRKMLKRATEHKLEDKLVLSLSKNLGEINRSRLKKYDEAIKAYRIALSRSPGDMQAHQYIAELYELENRTDKAIAEHYKLIELNPRNIASYQNLHRLFRESQRWDEAWCVCQVLTYLGHANADEKALFEKYRSRTLTQARRPLDKQHWALINHPGRSALLDQLFMRLYRHTVPLMSVTHKQLKLHKKKDRIDPAQQTPFNNVMNYVAQVTRLQRLDCFRATQGQSGLRAVPLNPPAMLVGADIMSGPKLQELAFIGSKQLYLMGQHSFLSTIDESYEQRKSRLFTVVYTLSKLVNPNGQVPFHDEALLGAFAQIPQPELQEMAKLMQKMSANPQQHLNLSKWLEMIEHSANRLGLVLCNDVGSALQVIRNEPGQFSRAPTQDRVREVVLFAMSENYFQLRKALGLAIG